MYVKLQADTDEECPGTLPVCYRCGKSNNYLSQIRDKCPGTFSRNNDVCEYCLHPNIRCYLTFDVLPLVEFEPTMSDHESLSLIFETPPHSSKQIPTSSDFFGLAINNVLENLEKDVYEPVRADESVLLQMSREDVFVNKSEKNCDCTKETSHRFFKNMIPEIGIAICQNCNSFFHEENFEYHSLKEESCPVCRQVIDTNVSRKFNSMICHTIFSLLIL